MKKLEGSLYRSGETVGNYNDSASIEVLEPGAYICKFTFIDDKANDEYLYAEFDICEGEKSGYFKRLSDRAGFWGGNVRFYYKGKAKDRIFGMMCKAVNISNPGYVFNPFSDGDNADEKTLIGKKFGMVFHEEEYYAKDGTLKSNVRAQATGVLNITKAAEGKFNPKLLEKKEAVKTSSNAPEASSGDFMTISDDDTEEIPFD